MPSIHGDVKSHVDKAIMEYEQEIKNKKIREAKAKYLQYELDKER
jgi:hypothetical protein